MNKEDVIEIERTPEFFKAAKDLSEYVNKLDLSTEKHNELVRLTIAQTRSAEKSGFTYGVKVGTKAKGLYDAMPRDCGVILS